MPTDNRIFHLVVRFSDTLFGVGDVVEKHNLVVAKHGAVWFGKLGSTLAQGRINLLNKQIEQGIPTFLYLVKGNRRKSTAYRAQLLSVTREMPAKEKRLVPSYYAKQGLLDYMRAWIKVGEIVPVEMSSLDNFRAMTSVLPLYETLARSSSGQFLVYEATGPSFQAHIQ
jgi:hypothetical protein